jgi:hypothetical protein
MWTEGLTDTVKLIGALLQLFTANVTRTEILYDHFTLGNYIKETEMARISGKIGKQGMHTKFWLGNLLKKTTGGDRKELRTKLNFHGASWAVDSYSAP